MKVNIKITDQNRVKPVPYKPLYCNDAEGRQWCPCYKPVYDVYGKFAYELCSHYNERLECDDGYKYSPKRCTKCMREVPVNKWITLKEALPLMKEGRIFKLHKDYWGVADYPLLGMCARDFHLMRMDKDGRYCWSEVFVPLSEETLTKNVWKDANIKHHIMKNEEDEGM